MRRKWFKVPFNKAPAANGAAAALLDAGNLRAAAGALAHMSESGLELERRTLDALLRLATARGAPKKQTLRIVSLLQRAGPLSADAVLQLLRSRPSAVQKLDLLGSAIAECTDADDLAVLLCAAAHALAASGAGERCAAWLRWMSDEGFDLDHADADAAAFGAVVGDEGEDEAAGMWPAAVRACGANVAASAALLAELRSGGDAALVAALVEHIRVRRRAADVDGAAAALRELREMGAAPPRRTSLSSRRWWRRSGRRWRGRPRRSSACTTTAPWTRRRHRSSSSSTSA